MNSKTSQTDYFAFSRMTLAAVATAPRVARAFVDRNLQRWGLTERAGDARLIMSELTANAVEATGIPQVNPPYPLLEHVALIGVQLRVQRDVLTLEVWDNSPATPVPREVDSESERGRGLFLVEALSDRWGVRRCGPRGKVVFAELAVERYGACGPVTSEYAPLPQRERVSFAGRIPVVQVVEQALLERVLEALRAW